MNLKPIHRFKQGEDLNIYRLGGALSGGVCMAMSVHYLIQRSRGHDFWDWFSHIRNKALVINSQGNGQTPGQYQGYLNSVIKSELRATWTGRGKYYNLADEFLRADAEIGGHIETGTYKMAVIEGVFGTGSHAVAFQRSPSIRFMDPNFGEYEFDGIYQFKTWMRKFMHHNYRNHKRFTIYSFDKY